MGAYHRGELNEAIHRLIAYFDTPEQKAILLNCLGSAENDSGDLAASLNYAEQALEIWRRLDSRKGIADSLSGLAAAHFGLGLPSARTDIDEAIALYQQIGDRRGEAFACRSRAEIAIQNGDLASAFADLQLGISISHSTDDPFSVLEHLDVLIHYHASAGDAECTVTIWSGCESNRKKIDSRRVLLKVALIDRDAVDLRQSLTPIRFKTVWARSAGFKLDETVQIATMNEYPHIRCYGGAIWRHSGQQHLQYVQHPS